MKTAIIYLGQDSAYSDLPTTTGIRRAVWRRQRLEVMNPPLIQNAYGLMV